MALPQIRYVDRRRWVPNAFIAETDVHGRTNIAFVHPSLGESRLIAVTLADRVILNAKRGVYRNR